MKVRELIKLLENNGWRQVTVSGHLGEDIPPGTLASVLKQAGVK